LKGKDSNTQNMYDLMSCEEPKGRFTQLYMLYSI